MTLLNIIFWFGVLCGVPLGGHLTLWYLDRKEA